jgi:MYXO-CTERM domain-containing protein
MRCNFLLFNEVTAGAVTAVCALLLAGLSAPARAESVYPATHAFASLAGLPSVGSADGTGSAARFYYPLGLAVDAAGNIYVADEKNHVIRRIAPGGVVTTLAGGSGYPGYTDGPAAAARFRLPKGVAVDTVGNLYVADAGNHAIRKITPAGVVSTLAGNGVSGSTDGIGAAARFHIPSGLAVDAAGVVYVADSNNNIIRKIASDGTVSTLAGTAGVYGSADGTGAAAGFFYPLAVAVDAAGTVYVTEIGNNTVRKITPAGVVTTLAGKAGTFGTDDGLGSAARFKSPEGIAVDAAGNVYVADRAIRKITPAGAVTTIAGASGVVGSADGTAGAARFRSPSGIAVDATGNLFISDRDNNNVRKITPAADVTTYAGVGLEASAGSVDGSASAARFREPAGLAVTASGDVYVADAGNQTIRKVAPTGATVTYAGANGQSGSTDGAATAARFITPFGLAADVQGNLYVAVAGNNTIRKITPAGTVSTLAGSSSVAGSADGTGTEARFYAPEGVAVDPAGNVYVSDTGNHKIRKITPAGVVSTLAGAGVSGYADGTGETARFREPSGIAADATGNVYVADWGNHAIRKITPAGVVTTFAGSGGVLGDADGTGSAARFQLPSGVAVDAAGNVYVADTLNHTIRKITSAGVVTTLAGLAEAKGSAAGKGSDARFSHPLGIAVDAAGAIYVTNNFTDSNSVYRGQLVGFPLITTQPQSVTVTAGAAAQFSVVVAADPAPTYQWFFNGNALSGATAGTYSLTAAQAANAGDYTVVVTNSVGSVTSAKATLTVNAVVTPPPPAPSSGGGGGGGGAPSGWFLAALGAAWLVRRRRQDCPT